MKACHELQTLIDLSPEQRQQISALLNQLLADVFDLYSQTREAHWNVRGLRFFQLHKLFGEFAMELEGFTDLLAERVAALGHFARGTVRMAAAASRLAEYPPEFTGSLDTVKVLATRYAALAKTTRAAIGTALEWNDQDTADLLTEISRALDKGLWFLEAHLDGLEN